MAPSESKTVYVVEALSNGTWRKVRGLEGGPWATFDRADRIARGRENSPRRSSSTEGLPHRVSERTVPV